MSHIVTEVMESQICSPFFLNTAIVVNLRWLSPFQNQRSLCKWVMQPMGQYSQVVYLVGKSLEEIVQVRKESGARVKETQMSWASGRQWSQRSYDNLHQLRDSRQVCTLRAQATGRFCIWQGLSPPQEACILLVLGGGRFQGWGRRMPMIFLSHIHEFSYFATWLKICLLHINYFPWSNSFLFILLPSPKKQINKSF